MFESRAAIGKYCIEGLLLAKTSAQIRSSNCFRAENGTVKICIATAKAVKAMRVIAPFDSAQGAMTFFALATAIKANTQSLILRVKYTIATRQYLDK